MIKDIIVLIYNLFCIAIWLGVLVLIIMAAVESESFQAWGDTYVEGSKLRIMLQIANAVALIELLFACVGWTRNSAFTVFLQVIGKNATTFLAFPLVPKASESTIFIAKYPIIQIAILMWSSTEPIRYSYNTFQSLKNGLVGHLRYNMFWILYPVGVGAEMCTWWAARCYIVSIEDENERPLTVLMPNKMNVAIRFEWVIYFTLLSYCIGFPQLYSHMIAQHKRFYEKSSKEMTI